MEADTTIKDPYIEFSEPQDIYMPDEVVKLTFEGFHLYPKKLKEVMNEISETLYKTINFQPNHFFLKRICDGCGELLEDDGSCKTEGCFYSKKEQKQISKDWDKWAEEKNKELARENQQV